MPEHLHYEDDDLFNPETKHEESDVSIKGLFIFIIGFVVFAVVTHLALWLMFKALIKSERADPRRLTELQRPAELNVPQNQPLLQPFPRQTGPKPTDVMPPYRNTPVTDLVDMHEAENKQLTQYGWVDKQKGVVRVPIDVAKQMLLQRGLPTVQQTPATPQLTTGGTPTGEPLTPEQAPSGVQNTQVPGNAAQTPVPPPTTTQPLNTGTPRP
ncbi:MAG TPA: hypothetical protein VF618_14230 [Thermoanaerobaculia bacterium]